VSGDRIVHAWPGKHAPCVEDLADLADVAPNAGSAS